MTDQQIEPTAAVPPQRKKRSNAESTRLAVALVAGALIAVFAVLNTDDVKVDWILGSGQTPLIIVILVCLLLGAGIGYFSGRRGSRKRRSEQG